MTTTSGKDVRDILDLPQRQQSNQAPSSSLQATAPPPPPPPPSTSLRPPTHPSSHRTKAKPKIDGITRELHALLGDNAPSLAVAHTHARAMLAQDAIGTDAQPRGFRPKFKRKDKKAIGWQWKPFRNPARSDDLVLHHWVQAKEAPQSNKITTGTTLDATGPPDATVVEKEYPHAVFNTSSAAYTYSSDEYAQYLRDDDWSKEETDHLIDLCQTYDLRFVIIADRWDFPATAHKKRTMEDLKARYYAICRRLIRSRISVEDMESRQRLLQTYAFDKAAEVERKQALARLFTRTPEQLAEEEALYVEARRLEQQEAQFSADREDLLKLLGGWERVPDVSAGLIAEAGAGISSGTAVIPGTPGAAEDLNQHDGRRKKRRLDGTAADDDVATTTSTAAKGISTLSTKQRAELKQAHFDEHHCITRFDPESAPLGRPPYPFLVGTPSTAPPLAPSSNNPSSSHGVYMRSTRLLAPRQTQLNRTMQTLAELTPPIGPRLVFPTRSNCEKWEGLLGAVTSGLEMKKQTDRVESEFRIAKNRLASLNVNASSGGGSGGGQKEGSVLSSNARGSTVGLTSRSSRSHTPALVPGNTAAQSTTTAAAGGAGVGAGVADDLKEEKSGRIDGDVEGDDETYLDATSDGGGVGGEPGAAVGGGEGGGDKGTGSTEVAGDESLSDEDMEDD